MPVTFWMPPPGPHHGSGTTEDLSLNGVRFVSRTPIPVGSRVRIACEFCSAVGALRSLRPDPASPRTQWQCGVEFLTLRIKHARGGLFSTVP